MAGRLAGTTILVQWCDDEFGSTLTKITGWGPSMNAQVIFPHFSCDVIGSLADRVPFILSAYDSGERIFAQGDPADSVFYVATGKVKCTIISGDGKEGVVGILKAGEFFGEACVTGEMNRSLNATAMTLCSVARISKSIVMRMIYENPSFAELFISFLVDRSARIQDDLLDHLLNNSEQRLARALLLLADPGKEREELILPRMTQNDLAEIVGTTRSRINHFMKKFSRLGFIDYNNTRCSQIRIYPSRLGSTLSEGLEWALSGPEHAPYYD